MLLREEKAPRKEAKQGRSNWRDEARMKSESGGTRGQKAEKEDKAGTILLREKHSRRRESND